MKQTHSHGLISNTEENDTRYSEFVQQSQNNSLITWTEGVTRTTRNYKQKCNSITASII